VRTDHLQAIVAAQAEELAALRELLAAEQMARRKAEEAAGEAVRLANTDGLTDLWNRRYFDAQFPLEVERSLRTGTPLGMLMVDVDHFRLYNNRYGHPTGDDVLRRVARLLLDGRRVNDVVARYGGEEFAVLLPNVESSTAAELAERLRSRVAGEPFPHGRLSISVGVAGCPTHSTTAGGLAAAADFALMAAKDGGRDRVVLAAGGVAAASPHAKRRAA